MACATLLLGFYYTQVRARIRAINSGATIIETRFSKVDPSQVLGIHGFDLDRVLAAEPDFLDEGGCA